MRIFLLDFEMPRKDLNELKINENRYKPQYDSNFMMNIKQYNR